MDAEASMLGELRGLRQRLPEVSGAVLASADGLPVAGDVPGSDRDTTAALAATNFGLGQRFAETMGHGPVRETVVYADGGLIVSYPAGGLAMLTVVADPGVDVARLHREGREVAHRVGWLYERVRATDSATTCADSPAARPTRAQTTGPSGLPTRRPRRPPARPW